MRRRYLSFLVFITMMATLFASAGNAAAEDTNAVCLNRLLIYSTEDGGWGYDRNLFNEDLPNILGEFGFEVTITDRIETPLITDLVLENYDQLWLICSDWEHVDPVVEGDFTEEEIASILAFREAGKGILIASDHYEFSLDANQISEPLGVKFHDWIYHGGTGINPFIVKHSLNISVDEIWGHSTEAKLRITNPDVEVIASHVGYDMIAVLDGLDAGYGRVVFDTSFTRFLDGDVISGEGPANIEFGDNAQYAINIANWLGYNTKLDHYVLDWLPPIAKRDVFKAGSTIPIKFSVHDKDTDEFISDETVYMDIYDEDDNVVAHYVYGKGKNFITTNGVQHYKINWHTKGFEPGNYKIVVDFEGYCSQLEKNIILR